MASGQNLQNQMQDLVHGDNMRQQETICDNMRQVFGDNVRLRLSLPEVIKQEVQNLNAQFKGPAVSLKVQLSA